jgi:hypothetical protein
MLSGVQTYDVSAYILVKGVMSDVSLEVFQRCVGAKRKTVIAVSEVSRTAYCDQLKRRPIFPTLLGPSRIGRSMRR